MEENGEMITVSNQDGTKGNEDGGLMIGLLHCPSHALTLLPEVFSMFGRLSVEELSRQLALCMDKK